MRKLLSLVLVSVITFSSVYAAQKVVKMEGSTTVLPIAQAASEKFMNLNLDVNISVRGGGSGVGIASLIEGTCDIADASRAIKDKELKKAVEKGVDPVAHVVAMDGIALIVHLSNTIEGLTKEQIKAIYTGKVSNWSELGGIKKKIVVISRDSASGTYEAFNKLALDKEKVRPDALLSASNRAVATTVEKTPGAIGYIGLEYITPKVKAVEEGNVKCRKETVLSGKYPLSRPLFMYTNGKPQGAVKRVIDYILSEDGQKIVEQVGFVGLQ